MLLSAKHLLESNIKSLEWVDGFFDIFEVNFNILKVKDDFECKKWKLLIDDDINKEDDMDELEEALSQGDITEEQFKRAISTSNKLKSGLLSNIDNFVEFTLRCREMVK